MNLDGRCQAAGQEEDRSEKQPPPRAPRDRVGADEVPVLVVLVVVEWLCTEALCGL